MKKHVTLGTMMTAALALVSCTHLVVRWPNRSEEKQDRTLEMTREENVFDDYLWATPPLYGRRLEFANGRATVEFAGRKIELETGEEGELVLVDGGRTEKPEFRTSARNCYYNLDILKTKAVPRSRYVSKTVWVTERVSVPKSRTVTRTVPVTRTRTHYDSFTKSTRTETYTDWETRMETEWYTDWENRNVMKTVWEWETVMERVIDIPAYAVYRLKTGAGDSLLVYKVDEDGKDAYYFQNVGYLSALEKSDGDRLFETPVRILIIDADSNGSYCDDDDLLMFNSWNPYSRGSAYREVRHYMDNFWYRLGFLRRENFTTFAADEGFTHLTIKNANSDFVGSEEKGRLVIRGLEPDMRLTINGKRYGRIKKGVFESEIEYGYFNLRIAKSGRMDFRTTFRVDGGHNEIVIDYEPTPAAGGFILADHNFRNWKVVFDDGKAPVTYYNENDISVPGGDYKVIISDGTTNFTLTLKIKAGEVWKYNFSEDKLEQKQAAAAEENVVGDVEDEEE